MDQDEAVFALIKIFAEAFRLRVLCRLTAVSYLSRQQLDLSLGR